jgi:TRAP-type C4-dicarboxylate transport system permease small subunit
MNRFINASLVLCADIAGLALLALMSMTVLDIVGRNLHLYSLRGTIELSTGVTVLIGFLAFPYSFLRGGHLVLDTFTASLPNWITRSIDVFWCGFAAVAFGIVAYLMWLSVLDVYRSNDISMDLQMPMVWLWIPAAAGMTLSPIACVVAAWRLQRDR